MIGTKGFWGLGNSLLPPSLPWRTAIVAQMGGQADTLAYPQLFLPGVLLPPA